MRHAKPFMETGIGSTLLAAGLDYLDSPVKTIAIAVAIITFGIAASIVVVHEYRGRKQRREIAHQLPLPGTTRQ